MATKELMTRICLKTDTWANWELSNATTQTNKTNGDFVLKNGEVGICVVPADTSSSASTHEPAILFKVGDGSTAFKLLPWVSAKAADVYDWAKSATKPTYAASEITGLQAFVEEYSDYDTNTNTTYQLEQDTTDGHKIRINYKEIGDTDWTQGSWVTIPISTLVEGETNGTVKFNGNSVSVHGLGSAAYKDESYFAKASDVSSIQDTIDEAVSAGTASLDYTATGMGVGKTIASLTESDGIIAATFQDISITKSQVSDFVHTHDDRYYTESEIDTALGGKQDNLSFEGTYNATNNKVATKSYVDTAVAGIVDSAPSALDTLNELAAALGDDPNFATTIATQIGNKVDKVEGKGLSTNDYDATEKSNVNTAYTHSQSTHARTDATKVEASTTNGNIKINGTETTVYTEVANTVHDASYVHTDNNYTTAEKNKLAGVAANANNYSHPTYTSKSSGLYKITVDGTGHISVASTVEKSDITALGIPAQDTVYTHPTTTAVSAAAVKVGNDASGHVVLGDALTYNDVGAAASSHTHSQADIIQASGDVLILYSGTSTEVI